jgi:hypothetical protein
LSALLDAELLVARKASMSVIQTAYEKAISLANGGGFMQDAAIANERAGRYYVGRKLHQHWAGYYLNMAKDLFSEWGAIAKVVQMEQHYGQVAVSDTLTESTSVLASLSPRKNNSVDGRSRRKEIDLAAKSRDLPFVPMSDSTKGSSSIHEDSGADRTRLNPLFSSKIEEGSVL